MSMQMSMIKAPSSDLPPFNNDFILNWRTRVFERIPQVMEGMIKEALVLVEQHGFKYEGFRKLTPEETIFHLTTKIKSTDPTSFFEVHKNTLVMGEFKFSFNGSTIISKVYIPFLKNHSAHYAGVDYYPDLPISERCIHANNVTGLLTVKVNRAPLMFWKSIQHPYIDITGKKVFKEVVVTTKLHFGKKAIKKNNTTPLILYFLVNGFENTLHQLGINSNDLQVVDYYDSETDSKHFYFEIRVFNRTEHVDNIYIKVKKKAMENVQVRRFISSLMYTLEDFKRPYTIRDIYDPEATLWYHILGSRVYINKSLIDQDPVVIDHAREHCEINNTLIDSLTKKAFQSVGINIQDFNHFLYIVYENIHKWCADYNPSDLYDKRINYNTIFGGFNYKLFSDIFKLMKEIKKKKKKTVDEHKHLLQYLAAHKPTWFNVGGMFMTNPTVYNSFVGLTLVHRFLSASTSESSEGRKGGKHVQKSLLLAHPSQLTITSINTVPSSSPVISGSINPFINVDDEGNIIVAPDLIEYTRSCFTVED